MFINSSNYPQRLGILNYHLSFEEVIFLFALLSINNFIKGGATIAYMQNKIINSPLQKTNNNFNVPTLCELFDDLMI